MILELEEVKKWIRLDADDEDDIVQMLINAAEEYLVNATGKSFAEANNLAKLFCLVLIAEWYDDRKLIGQVTEKIRFTIDSILMQLQYCEVEADADHVES